MRERVAKFNVDTITPQELAGAAGRRRHHIGEKEGDDNLIDQKACGAWTNQ
jgi:hypothetical protein